MTKSSSLTKVSSFISKLNQEKENTVRQRLKEWYQEAQAKTGSHRAELKVEDCFARLLSWVVNLLPQECCQLPLALDATTVKQNFTVLSINVLYRSCAIPVAWKVVKTTDKGSWKPYWTQLLASLQNVVPNHWSVIVCADRGLYADWLYDSITNLGWHPFLRINHQGQFRPSGSSQWRNLAEVVPVTNMSWSGQITCFKTNPIDCTLLARWDDGYTAPWLILTDLNPTSSDASWYGLRSWIECSYRDIKSDGWQWQNTRLTNPHRAERHWLAMAVALFWLVTVGGEQDQLANSGVSCEPLSKSNLPISRRPTRQLSCFVNGLLTVLAHLLNGQSLSFGRLHPLPFTHSRHFFFSNST